MSELKSIEKILKKHKEYLQKKFYVEKIGVFGSYSKGEETSESDIDILVKFNGPIGWDFIELNEYLESILGKKVDLVSIKALKRQLKDIILKEVIYI
jgi:predicted nucleotidyltransferase